MQKLNNNTLALQALLTKVNNLPEGGSSGGGGASVETCTVNVTMTSGFDIVAYGALIYENGQYSVAYRDNAQNVEAPPFTIENVVCDSALFIGFTAIEPRSNVSGNCLPMNDSSLSYFRFFLLSATPDEVITIELYDND